MNLGECHIEGLSFWVVPSVFAKISHEIKANKVTQSQKHENFCKLSFAGLSTKHRDKQQT
jgi:hypothetical protein